MLSVLSVMLMGSLAQAGSCDSLVAAAGKAKGEALVTAFRSLAKCDAQVAGREFERFMLASGDLETLIGLGIAAIDADAYAGLWSGMGRVPYEHRGPLAEAVGAACADHPKVLPFLQGAYAGLKGVDFEAWEPALKGCASEALDGWLAKVAQEPPSSPYNDKYHLILRTYARHKGVDALPALEAAAILAGTRGGPFNTVVETIQAAVQPRSVSAQMSADDRAKMEASLGRVAKAVPVELARVVADRLLNAGSADAAAGLLASVFADRMEGGALRWAAASVESCDGEAIVHWATWTEAPTRWSVLEGATKALREVAPKLKCTAKDVWPVEASQEPLRGGSKSAGAWVEELVATWSAKGLKVKAKEEKVTVP